MPSKHIFILAIGVTALVLLSGVGYIVFTPRDRGPEGESSKTAPLRVPILERAENFQDETPTSNNGENPRQGESKNNQALDTSTSQEAHISAQQEKQSSVISSELAPDTSAGFPLFQNPRPLSSVSEIQPIIDKLETQAQQLTQKFAEQYMKTHVPTSTPPYTEEDVFRAVWPDDMREGLHIAQDALVREGFFPEHQKRSFNEEQDIYDFYRDILSFLKTNEFIKEEEFTSLHNGLTVELPRIIQEEKARLRFGLKIGALRILSSPLQSMPAQGAVRQLLTSLVRLFKVQTAHALFPGWHTLPSCYKDTNPVWPIGFNAWAPCCNCGFRFQRVSFACVPVPVFNCGTFNVICDSGIAQGCPPGIRLGCLNLTCFGWPNAIWDGPIGTGICGCG